MSKKITARLRKHGPMFCKDASCANFRKAEPRFAQQLQDAKIVAHYMGFDPLIGEEMWLLDGITPVNRASLKALVDGMPAHTFRKLPAGTLVRVEIDKA